MRLLAHLHLAGWDFLQRTGSRLSATPGPHSGFGDSKRPARFSHQHSGTEHASSLTRLVSTPDFQQRFLGEGKPPGMALIDPDYFLLEVTGAAVAGGLGDPCVTLAS